MKLKDINVALSNGFIRPKLNEIKKGDLVYYRSTGDGTKYYCIVTNIEKNSDDLDNPYIYGNWCRDKSYARKHVYKGGFMCLNDVYKVI